MCIVIGYERIRSVIFVDVGQQLADHADAGGIALAVLAADAEMERFGGFNLSGAC